MSEMIRKLTDFRFAARTQVYQQAQEERLEKHNPLLQCTAVRETLVSVGILFESLRRTQKARASKKMTR